MNILDACATVIREYTMQEGENEVLQAIEYLKTTRKNFPLVISDREWLFNFVVYRPDLRWKVPEVSTHLPVALFQGDITAQSIWQWIDEALSMVPLCALPAIPETSDHNPWWAVMIEEKLYCCGCRSLYEGIPLTESQMDDLRDERATFCTECDGDL